MSLCLFLIVDSWWMSQYYNKYVSFFFISSVHFVCMIFRVVIAIIIVGSSDILLYISPHKYDAARGGVSFIWSNMSIGFGNWLPVPYSVLTYGYGVSYRIIGYVWRFFSNQLWHIQSWIDWLVHSYITVWGQFR